MSAPTGRRRALAKASLAPVSPLCGLRMRLYSHAVYLPLRTLSSVSSTPLYLSAVPRLAAGTTPLPPSTRLTASPGVA